MASIKRRAAKGDIEVGSERDLIVLFSSESDTESIVGSPQKQRPWPTLTSRSGDRKCVRTGKVQYSRRRFIFFRCVLIVCVLRGVLERRVHSGKLTRSCP